MSNKSDASYRRYVQYRANRQQFKMDQIAAPIVAMIFIGFITKFWWLFAAIVISLIVKRIKNTSKMLDNKVAVSQNEMMTKEAERMPMERRTNMELKSTDTGYINKNNQKNLGKTSKPGTDNNQWFYQMECLKCGHQYYANGTDIWLRKCPKCQGGRP